MTNDKVKECYASLKKGDDAASAELRLPSLVLTHITVQLFFDPFILNHPVSTILSFCSCNT